MAAPWARWQAAAERFVGSDGRVSEREGGSRTTSLDQAQALFLALAAGDRPRFERILAWTRRNLAGGDLGRHLPARLWGADASGKPRVLDDNAASDADLWLGYTLVEAGRIWRSPELTSAGRGLLQLVASREIADLPGLGPLLLPAPRGSEALPGEIWRCNPSHAPLPLLRRCESLGLPGPWSKVAANTARLLFQSSRDGFVPDWVAWRRGRGFTTDLMTGPFFGADALRATLWVGMLAPDEPWRPSLQAALGGPERFWRAYDHVPALLLLGDQSPSLRTGPRDTAAQPGPLYLLPALVPGLVAKADVAALARLDAQLAAGPLARSPIWQIEALALLGHGFAEGRFRFAADGALLPGWQDPRRLDRGLERVGRPALPPRALVSVPPDGR